MTTKTKTNTAIVTSSTHSLEHVTDAELLSATRSLVGRSNQLLAALLAHLGEVEARGIHRAHACSSLYTYCIYELRLSEDEAFRRVAAARLVRRFPALFEEVAAGELHLTGLLMLGPHLTESNLLGVLARAKHRTKKEIARLVRQLDPLPDVPSRIEPLGPAPARLVPKAATWEAFTQSLCPVRELKPGDRPRDWVGNENDMEVVLGAVEVAVPDGTEGAAPAPARVDSTEPVGSQRYKVQFTATEEYVNLVERAKALLSRAMPNAELEEIQLRAMRAYVAELEKQRYAVGARPRRRASYESPEEPKPDAKTCDQRQRGRRVPAAVRRAVFERDEGRCSYIDASGKRCAETHRLELHHLSPFATGGEHTEKNLALRCAAHNALAAEEDSGREFVEEKRDALAHEAFASHERNGSG